MFLDFWTGVWQLRYHIIKIYPWFVSKYTVHTEEYLIHKVIVKRKGHPESGNPIFKRKKVIVRVLKRRLKFQLIIQEQSRIWVMSAPRSKEFALTPSHHWTNDVLYFNNKFDITYYLRGVKPLSWEWRQVWLQSQEPQQFSTSSGWEIAGIWIGLLWHRNRLGQ